MTDNHQQVRRAYSVWDRSTRWFHWINALCVAALTILGLAILNEKAFGVSPDGKVLLKTLHAYVGYVLALNLGWRLVWAFVGSTNARWNAILPMRPGFPAAVRTQVRGFFGGISRTYLGHNPLGRLMVSLLLLLLLVQAITGLVLAGTDLYKPPFGSLIADWVTGGDAEKLANITPGSKEFVDSAAYDDMRAYRKPIVTTHLYTFYVLMIAVLFHIVGVVVAEFRERSGLISAMFTGEKLLSEEPCDALSDPQKPGEGRSHASQP